MQYEKHGMSKTSLHRIWRLMKCRCSNPRHEKYKDYGGRGITVCPEWKNSFIAFRDWALANGYQEGLSIDRKDNSGNYEPSNCRWTTVKVQANNRRSNHLFTLNGETHTIKEWSELTGIHKNTIRMRIEKGLTGDQVLAAPMKGDTP